MSKIIKHTEASTILQSKLKDVINLKDFCRENNLEKSYQVILQIKNNKSKRIYPKIFIELFTLFGYSITYEKFFVINDEPNGKKTTNKKKVS